MAKKPSNEQTSKKAGTTSKTAKSSKSSKTTKAPAGSTKGGKK